jgi:hypothetical protein
LFLGWVQLVGAKSPSHPQRRFDIDPLQIFEGLDMPFGFYGLEPTLLSSAPFGGHGSETTLSVEVMSDNTVRAFVG